MGRPEAEVEGYFVKEAKRIGALTRKVQWVFQNYAPDRFVAFRGKYAFLEFKSPKGMLSRGQRLEVKNLVEHGVNVRVVDSRDKVDQVIQWLQEESNEATPRIPTFNI